MRHFLPFLIIFSVTGILSAQKFPKSNDKHGSFQFALREGSSRDYVKGLVVDGDKTFLVDIDYDPPKEKEVEDIVNSFFAEKIEPSSKKDELTYLKSNTDDSKQKVASSDDDEEEFIQKYDYPKFFQQKKTLPEVDLKEDPPKDEKHPKVKHANLIVLTQSQKEEFINAHNKWRSDVGVPPLKWSNDLENYAGEWAIINGKKNCKMVHRNNSPYGENLYWSSGKEFSPKGAVDSWGSEIKDYRGDVVGKTKAVVGHYTQIVWRKTNEVGCAAFKCGNALLVVCNYNPSGNWVGEHPYK